MKKIINLATALTFALVLSACSSGSDTASTAASATSEDNATELKLIASNWEFDQEEYTVAAGEPINFILENKAGFHGVQIKGLGIDLADGKAKQYTITEPGTYEIICSIQCGTGHSTMKSKLIVQ
jgi:cytochrome c oxidase subunit 2